MLATLRFWWRYKGTYAPKIIWLKRRSTFKEEIVVLNGAEFEKVKRIYIGDWAKNPQAYVMESRLFEEKK